MFNYQGGYQQQYGAYPPPMQVQPQRIQSYQPTLPIEYVVEPDISKDYDTEHKPYDYKMTKRLKLVEGNYVVDCLVSSKLLSIVPKKDDEFTHMRYTACTCDPDDFQKNKYTLRQEMFDRQTELFIAITMYNENVILFARTFHSVVKNIVHLCSRDRSRMWGADGWKKIVVCIISDGRNMIDQHVLAYLAVIGVYQDGVAKNKVNEREVSAHIYEYTTQISINPDIKQPKGADEGIVPIQVIFCLKEKQAKKINSHRWFFNAFGPILKPNVCVLLDVGTKPGGTSIYHLWKAFSNSNVAGACGEIVAMKGRGGVNLVNPIVAAQNYEYKMSNILDKPLESVFGYITVLPGAFSAYRYLALQNDHNGKGPLASYFLGELHQGENAGIFTANMYLAEDRILCFELIVKRDSSWVLRYVKSAYAETDVPDSVPELISQRRRWLNGSFFTGVYAICNTFSIWRSGHSFIRKILLHIEMAYQIFNLIFSWFALGNLYLAFYIFSKYLTLSGNGPWDGNISTIILEALQHIYITLLIVQFILAMGNRPQDLKWIYIFSMVFFAGIMMYSMFAAAWVTYKGISKEGFEGLTKFDIKSFTSDKITTWSIILSVASTYGIYLISSLLFFEPWHIFSSFAQYLLLVPFYVNVLNIYAFCNIHDVSWGTKGDTSIKYDLGVVRTTEKGEVEVETAEQIDINTAYEEASNKLSRHIKEDKPQSKAEKQGSYYRSFRTYVVLFWILSNVVLVLGITRDEGPKERSYYYMLVILWSVTGSTAFRFIGSCIFLLLRLFTRY